MECPKTSLVTCVTLVLWIGNETLRKLRTLWECPLGVPIVWRPIESRQFIGWWHGWHHQCSYVTSLYWRTRHLLLRFLCQKGPCRQRNELGSKRSVSFPIQRTRVMRVTRDVLFHRFTQCCVSEDALGTIYQTRQAKSAADYEPDSGLVQADKTWEPGAMSRSKL